MFEGAIIATVVLALTFIAVGPDVFVTMIPHIIIFALGAGSLSIGIIGIIGIKYNLEVNYMKAHIRKITKETYFKKLGEIFDKMDASKLDPASLDALDSIKSKMASEEYFNKMQEALYNDCNGGED